jgi:hypothetical protein
MTKEQFDALQELHSSECVFIDDDGDYVFTIGDIDRDTYSQERLDDLGTECERVGVGYHVAMGDDEPNAISVKDLSLIDKAEGLEQFLADCVGINCYSENWVDEDWEDDEWSGLPDE